MPTTDRIPVLVYDDGTANGRITMDRALPVASQILLAIAVRSPNQTRNVEAADHAGIPVEVVGLTAHTGIRHALALCAERDICLAHVPHPGQHPGEQLRKIIQAASENETNGQPVLAVRIVHPDAPQHGPVVEIDPAHADSGFAALFAAGLAATTSQPLHILRLAGDRSDADLRSADALRQARELIAENDIPTYDQTTDDDPSASAIESADAASAVVIGIGGLTISGRKPTAPDELPNRVLETPDGHLAHELSRHVHTDLVVVCDTLTLERGHLTKVAATTAALAAITAGTLTAGLAGLAVTAGAVAASTIGYTAARNAAHDSEAG